MQKDFDELIIAHAGESFLAPENTLTAINLAWQNGVSAVEIDVHLTLDNEIVVIHDKNTQRTGNCKKTIATSTLKELKTIDVGLFKGKQWQNEPIPTLSEVFQTIPHNGKLIIEIKTGNAIIPKLLSEIKKANLKTSQIEIISFNFEVLSEIKKHLFEHKILWILELDHYTPAWKLWVSSRKIIRKVIKHQLNGVDVWAGKIVNKNFVKQFKKHHLLVYTWTINDLTTAKNLINIGVDAITSDRPSWLKHQLNNTIFEKKINF